MESKVHAGSGSSPAAKRQRLAQGVGGDNNGRFSDDILHVIFSYLVTSDLGSASLVNKQWSKVFEDGADGTIVVGGFREGELYLRYESRSRVVDEILLFSTKKKEWIVSPVGAQGGALSQMVRAGRYFYVVTENRNKRGHDDILASPGSLSRFDPYCDVWSSGDSNLKPRSEFGTAAVAGKIYAIGGKIAFKDKGSVQGCDPKSADDGTFHFTTYPSVKHPRGRSMTSAATLHGDIYVSGGHEGLAQGPSTSAERWTPGSESWTPVASMKKGRWAHKSCSVGEHVYVVGGLSECEAHENPFSPELSVERYCPSTNRWDFVTTLPTVRDRFDVAVIGSCIYVIGGRVHTCQHRDYEGKPTSLVEIFDTKTGTWSTGVPLPKAVEVDACASFARFDH